MFSVLFDKIYQNYLAEPQKRRKEKGKRRENRKGEGGSEGEKIFKKLKTYH